MLVALSDCASALCGLASAEAAPRGAIWSSAPPRSNRGSSSWCYPVAEGVPREGPIVILGLAGDLDAEPRWTVKSFVFMAELDLGDDETAVVTGEHVHFPRMLLPRDDEARLFNQAAIAQREERLRVEYGDGVLDLEATQLGSLGLDRHRRIGAVLDAHACGRTLPLSQVGLTNAGFRSCKASPCLAAHEEFPFDLNRHDAPLNSSGRIVTTVPSRLSLGSASGDV